jgi:hypothetical protein
MGSFEKLHDEICDILRAGRPRIVAEIRIPSGEVQIAYDDGSRRTITEERRDSHTN